MNDGAYPYYANATPRYPIDATPETIAAIKAEKENLDRLDLSLKMPDLSVKEQNLNNGRGGVQSVMGGSAAGSMVLPDPGGFLKGDK